MREEKGVVMEVERGKAVVLTGRGEFRQVRLQGQRPEVGEELFLNGGLAISPWLKWAAAAVFLIAAGTFLARGAFLSPVQPGQPLEVATPETSPIPRVVAYVTVDINPSLELGLAEDSQVVSVEALNEDGQKLLDTVEIKGQKAEEALASITGRAVDLGYLKDNGPNAIFIAVATPEADNSGKELEKRLQEKASGELARRKVRAEVSGVQVNEELRKKAREAGISAGKYVIMLEAMRDGLNLDPDSLRHKGIGSAVKEAGGNLGEIMRQTRQEKDLKGLEKKFQEQLKEKLKTAGTPNIQDGSKPPASVPPPKAKPSRPEGEGKADPIGKIEKDGKAKDSGGTKSAAGKQKARKEEKPDRERENLTKTRPEKDEKAGRGDKLEKNRKIEVPEAAQEKERSGKEEPPGKQATSEEGNREQ